MTEFDLAAALRETHSDEGPDWNVPGVVAMDFEARAALVLEYVRFN